MLSALLFAFSVPLWGESAKTYPIESASTTLYCKPTRRDLPVKATWPVGSFKAPVIVFSHGYGGSKDGYEPMAAHWAKHGYVVLRMTHADSNRLKGALASRERLANEPAADFSNALDRPKEVAFVIDSLAKLEEKIPALKGRLDASRIGIGGHSLGAHTAMLCAGGKTKLGRSLPEKRAKAFLLMSPQGVGGGLDEESWSEIKSPMMVVSGSRDVSILGRTTDPERRRDPFTYSPPGDKYLLWMEGADHGLGGVARESPRGLRRLIRAHNPDQLRTVQAVSLAFFDAHVKGDKAALDWLKTKDLAASLPAKSEFLRK